MSKAARAAGAVTILVLSVAGIAACGSGGGSAEECDAAVARIDDKAPSKTEWVAQVKDSLAKCGSADAWLTAAHAHPNSFGKTGESGAVDAATLTQLCTLVDGKGLPACV